MHVDHLSESKNKNVLDTKKQRLRPMQYRTCVSARLQFESCSLPVPVPAVLQLLPLVISKAILESFALS